MRLDLRPWFGLDVGRPDYVRRDACIFIGFGWREPEDGGAIPWRHTLSIAWDWLPKFCWVDYGHSFSFGLPGSDHADSSLWTGRTWRLERVSWFFRIDWF